MLHGSKFYFVPIHPVGEPKLTCEPFVDRARGVVGFGLTYGEYSYNHQPLFGATFPSSSPPSYVEPTFAPHLGGTTASHVSTSLTTGAVLPSSPGLGLRVGDLW